jgi:RNA polymerase sigma-70 factor (ECF subfamily)
VDCPELLEALTVYREADIDQAACERIEVHMARCPRCTEACESLKRTVSLCRAIPGIQVPASVRAAVRQAVAQATGLQLEGAG